MHPIELIWEWAREQGRFTTEMCIIPETHACPISKSPRSIHQPFTEIWRPVDNPMPHRPIIRVFYVDKIYQIRRQRGLKWLAKISPTDPDLLEKLEKIVYEELGYPAPAP